MFGSRYLEQMEQNTRDVGAELREFNGRAGHFHLASCPLTVAISRLVNSLKGVPSRRLRQEFPDLRRPFPGTGTGCLPGPGDAPAADDHDCGIPGCLEATRRRLHTTILRWSLDLLSGPGGLASHLRGTVLGAPFNTLSQPLDIGRTTRTIPPHLRTAVIQRDQHCAFPGCTQPLGL